MKKEAGQPKAIQATKGQVALLRSLRKRKGRRETGLFLVEGVRLCESLVRAEMKVDMVLVASEREGDERLEVLAAAFERRGALVVRAPEWRVGRVSDTVHCQGIVAAAQWREHGLSDLRFVGRSRVVALDGVADPGNVGTIVRTAAWFGATAVVLGRGCADLLNPKTVRATMGGLFHLPVVRDIGLCEGISALKAQGFHVMVAGLAGSVAWRGWAEGERSVLVLGSEAEGVSAEVRGLADEVLAIPCAGAGESLNVAVSAGIFLSAMSRGG